MYLSDEDSTDNEIQHVLQWNNNSKMEGPSHAHLLNDTTINELSAFCGVIVQTYTPES